MRMRSHKICARAHAGAFSTPIIIAYINFATANGRRWVGGKNNYATDSVCRCVCRFVFACLSAGWLAERLQSYASANPVRCVCHADGGVFCVSVCLVGQSLMHFSDAVRCPVWCWWPSEIPTRRASSRAAFSFAYKSPNGEIHDNGQLVRGQSGHHVHPPHVHALFTYTYAWAPDSTAHANRVQRIWLASTSWQSGDVRRSPRQQKVAFTSPAKARAHASGNRAQYLCCPNTHARACVNNNTLLCIFLRRIFPDNLLAVCG